MIVAIPSSSLKPLHLDYFKFFQKGGENMVEIGPQTGLVLDGRKVPTHPLVVGRTEGAAATSILPTVALAAESAASSIPSALELATTIDHKLQRAIETMDGESAMPIVKDGREVRSALEIATTVDRVVLASVGSMDGKE